MIMKPIASKRHDKRGHWPAGKRRHADSGQWSRTRLTISALVNEHYSHGVRSMRALAVAVGVSDRAVRRWLSGEDRPSPQMQVMCQRWAIEQRAAIKRESKPSVAAPQS